MSENADDNLRTRAERWLDSAEGSAVVSHAIDSGCNLTESRALLRVAFMAGACDGEQWMGERLLGKLEGMAK